MPRVTLLDQKGCRTDGIENECSAPFCFCHSGADVVIEVRGDTCRGKDGGGSCGVLFRTFILDLK